MNADPKNDAVIILAAGEAKRLGMPKGLVRFRSRPWIQCQIEDLRKLGFEKIVVVLGPDAPRYFSELPGLQSISVINTAVEQGPFLSILFGIEALAPFQPKQIWILPVDVPVAGEKVWSALGEIHGAAAVVPSFKEKGGHPVKLSFEWAKVLLTQKISPEENRFDVQIQKLPPEQKRWVVVGDERVTLNLNTKQEFEAYESRVNTH